MSNSSNSNKINQENGSSGVVSSSGNNSNNNLKKGEQQQKTLLESTFDYRNVLNVSMGAFYLVTACFLLVLFVELPLAPLLRMMHQSLDAQGEYKAICTNCTYLVNKVDVAAMKPRVLGKHFEAQMQAMCAPSSSLSFVAQQQQQQQLNLNDINNENEEQASSDNNQDDANSDNNNDNNNNNNENDEKATTSTPPSSNCQKLSTFYKENLRTRFKQIVSIKKRFTQEQKLQKRHQQQLANAKKSDAEKSKALSHKDSVVSSTTSSPPPPSPLPQSSLTTLLNSIQVQSSNTQHFNWDGNKQGGGGGGGGPGSSGSVSLRDTLTRNSSPQQQTAAILSSGIFPNAPEFCSLHCRPAGPGVMFESGILNNLRSLLPSLSFSSASSSSSSSPPLSSVIAVYALAALRNYGRIGFFLSFLGIWTFFILWCRKTVGYDTRALSVFDVETKRAMVIRSKILEGQQQQQLSNKDEGGRGEMGDDDNGNNHSTTIKKKKGDNNDDSSSSASAAAVTTLFSSSPLFMNGKGLQVSKILDESSMTDEELKDIMINGSSDRCFGQFKKVLWDKIMNNNTTGDHHHQRNRSRTPATSKSGTPKATISSGNMKKSSMNGNTAMNKNVNDGRATTPSSSSAARSKESKKSA